MILHEQNQGTVYFFDQDFFFFLHSNVMVPISHFFSFSLFALVSNVLPEVYELDTMVSWSWWSPQILADQGSLGLASLDCWVHWPFCKLHPRCKRPSGVLICLGSDATHGVIFTTREFCVKEEILPSSATSYTLLSKNLRLFSDSGGKKSIISWPPFSASFTVGKMIRKDQPLINFQGLQLCFTFFFLLI